MLKQLITKIKEAFTYKEDCNTLESYIISRNPQSVYDIDAFEREYNREQSEKAGIYRYFPNGGTYR